MGQEKEREGKGGEKDKKVGAWSGAVVGAFPSWSKRIIISRATRRLNEKCCCCFPDCRCWLRRVLKDKKGKEREGKTRRRGVRVGRREVIRIIKMTK